MKDISFEKALEKLEKIVEDLERGDFPLDELIKKHEEGVKLAKMCKEKLDKARGKIELLSKDASGGFETEDFDVEE